MSNYVQFLSKYDFNMSKFCLTLESICDAAWSNYDLFLTRMLCAALPGWFDRFSGSQAPSGATSTCKTRLFCARYDP